MNASKVSALLQAVDKVVGSSQSSSGTRSPPPDDVAQARSATGRLYQHVNGLDRHGKELFVKTTGNVARLIAILNTSRDCDTIKNLVLLFCELIGRVNTGKRASILSSQGLTHTLFGLLVREGRDLLDEPFLAIHHTLSKLALKDRKFAVKARLSQAMHLTLSFLKIHCASTSQKVLTPILTVIKQYSANAVNSSWLGKNGVVSYLFKVLTNSTKKNASQLAKITLESLVLLLKSKSNSARAVGFGGVPVLLQTFQEWHKLDTKNKHIQLRKVILNVIKHVTDLRSGCQAVSEAGGISTLYTICKEISDVRELEPLVIAASVILRKCFPKQRLPCAAGRTVLLFRLPTSDIHLVESLSPDAACWNGVTGPESGDEEDDSSLDHDDDLSSDEYPGHRKPPSDDDEVSSDEGRQPLYVREDIHTYTNFFSEIRDMQIPEYDVCAFTLSLHTSLPDIGAAHGGPTARCTGSVLAAAGHRCQTENEASFAPNPAYPPIVGCGRAGAKNKLSGGVRVEDLLGCSSSDLRGSGSETASRSVSAVNMKTGQPVFSLEAIAAAAETKQQHRGTKLHTTSSSSLAGGSSSSSLSPKARLSLTHSANPVPVHASKTEPLLGDFLSRVNQPYDWLKPEENHPSPPFKPVHTASTSGVGSGSSSFTKDSGLHSWPDRDTYKDLAASTVSVGRFAKLAYPDLYGHKSTLKKEPLYEKSFGVQRVKVFEDIDRLLHPETLLNRVVYDLDEVIGCLGDLYTSEQSVLDNRDRERLGHPESSSGCLLFNSQFESGNLRKAIQIRELEYDLVLCPDVNTNHHHQWFYFEVSNMKAGQPYRFNIINNEKQNSQFNYGMRPVMFSVQSAVLGQPHWVRVGEDICYYRNHFSRSSLVTGGVKGKLYFSTTFTVTFPHDYDVCYLAYHYPYTYTTLKAHLHQLEKSIDPGTLYYRHQTLCMTLGGNEVPLLTITSQPQNREEGEGFPNRPYIFLSSRVHPGESNASWVMKGSIDFLLSDKPAAQALRQMYVFKIVPMLNPDGVINGNHRCSLTSEDLNRSWSAPCPRLHPTVYHTKGLLLHMRQRGIPPLVFCDYHGHSRRKNVFLYGCSPSLSWMVDDVNNPAVAPDRLEDASCKTLPRLLSQIAPAFSYSYCSFVVEKSKESTARVVVWRQIGILRSYTMESSYCGCDTGPYSGYHINPFHLEEMGRAFCDVLTRVRQRPRVSIPGGSSASYLTPPPSLAVPGASSGGKGGASGQSEGSSGRGAAGVALSDMLGAVADTDTDDEEEIEIGQHGIEGDDLTDYLQGPGSSRRAGSARLTHQPDCDLSGDDEEEVEREGAEDDDEGDDEDGVVW